MGVGERRCPRCGGACPTASFGGRFMNPGRCSKELEAVVDPRWEWEAARREWEGSWPREVVGPFGVEGRDWWW